ncbi:hypothetical protein C484_15974 [Natrialba taiwanensis DSM 12281]|uniref:Uncharacterized protein n=1 Tax=Natrialba taiwanensis DSM 12281 TaxID=1230458 RepID=L9ZPD3_9EURY|nr:hypothetical protein C484_15974 [Natrialba taiwanensis DSM 12281]
MVVSSGAVLVEQSRNAEIVFARARWDSNHGHSNASLIRIPVPLLLTSFADNGHDGIRTHDHRMASPIAIPMRIEVRRSVRTELRAHEFVITFVFVRPIYTL